MKHLNRLPQLAVLLAVPLLMVPAAQIPEKLTAGTAQWNTSAQAVEERGGDPVRRRLVPKLPFGNSLLSKLPFRQSSSRACERTSRGQRVPERKFRHKSVDLVGIGCDPVYPEPTRFVTTRWLVRAKMSHERRAR